VPDEEAPVTEVPLRVDIRRSGGFAGIDVHSAADTADMPPEEAEELRRVVTRADLRELTRRLSDAPPPSRPDRFQYDVTVHEGSQTYEFTVHDGAVPPEVKPLLDLVQSRGRRQT